MSDGTVVAAKVGIWTEQQQQQSSDLVATEKAVALVYNGISHAVMMATPKDLELFALGFSLTEGIIDCSDELFDYEVKEEKNGIEIGLTISNHSFSRLKNRRRSLVGRTGCGICGAESLEQARPLSEPVVSDFRLSHAAIDRATRALQGHQPLQTKTGAVHCAAWCNANGDIVRVCEDVGRHNALDKLIGYLSQEKLLQARPQQAPHGFVLISSRASYEMLQKSAKVNLGAVVAVSAATSLAIEVADQAGITLVGFSRDGRHVAYSNSQNLRD